MMKSTHAVGDVNFHRGVIDGPGVGARDGEFERTRADRAVDHWNLLGCGGLLGR